MRPLPPRRTAAAATALTLLFATPGMATAVNDDTSSTDTGVQWAPIEPDPGQVEDGSPTLNLEDAQRISGTHTVVSSPSSPGANPTEIRVDGAAAADARETLGSEYLDETDSALVLDVKAAIEIAYSNYLLVNGERVAILEQIAHVNDHPINVPAELLTTGENSIEFWTGTRASACGLNHDDGSQTSAFRDQTAHSTRTRTTRLRDPLLALTVTTTSVTATAVPPTSPATSHFRSMLMMSRSRTRACSLSSIPPNLRMAPTPSRQRPETPRQRPRSLSTTPAPPSPPPCRPTETKSSARSRSTQHLLMMLA